MMKHKELPPGVRNIIRLMKDGHTLHGGRFGMWTMNLIDSRCTNVNMNTAYSMLDRGLIVKKKDSREWVLKEDLK